MAEWLVRKDGERDESIRLSHCICTRANVGFSKNLYKELMKLFRSHCQLIVV